jgi:hypothetical protein
VTEVSTDVIFSLVTNACPPAAIAQIDEFARRHRDRVIEVFDSSETRMVAHGVAVDVVRLARNDGELFWQAPAVYRADRVPSRRPTPTAG